MSCGCIPLMAFDFHWKVFPLQCGPTVHFKRTDWNTVLCAMKCKGESWEFFWFASFLSFFTSFFFNSHHNKVNGNAAICSGQGRVNLKGKCCTVNRASWKQFWTEIASIHSRDQLIKVVHKWCKNHFTWKNTYTDNCRAAFSVWSDNRKPKWSWGGVEKRNKGKTQIA